MVTTLNPATHPLGAPVLNGNEITVDLMLQQPTRITRMLMDLTLQRFFVDRVFTNAGGVTGGAVIYDQATVNEIYADRDVQRVAPLSQFPVITSQRRAPGVAEVEKWGGKFPTSYEAKDRNQATVFTNEMRRLANTIVRKINQRGIDVLETAIATTGGASTFLGNNWATAIPNGNAPTAPSLTPGADFAKAQMLADIQEIGVVFDGLIWNPTDKEQFILFYGQNNWREVLAGYGITEDWVTNRCPVKVQYVYAAGQVGEMRVEQPLATKTWEDPEIEGWWTQSSVRPVMFVTNPYAVYKITHP